MFLASRENNKTRRNVGIERISPRTGKKFYIPDVPISDKPEVGMMFRTVDEVYTFYERYAKNGGFTIRKNTEALLWCIFIMHNYQDQWSRIEP
ncbi:hypothetical protein R6Q59_003272 [Mikania micrantha]